MIAGTRGGYTRAKIINALLDRPYNANQLSETLGLDYKTVKHHLDILRKNELIVSEGDKYGVVYFPSPTLEKSIDEFGKMWQKLQKDED